MKYILSLLSFFLVLNCFSQSPVVLENKDTLVFVTTTKDTTVSKQQTVTTTHTYQISRTTTIIKKYVPVGTEPVPPIILKGNAALNKTVTVSSVEAGTTFSGNLAVDGNVLTRWASAYSDPQSISIDLGVNAVIDQVKVLWEAAYAKDYLIQTSINNTNWTTVKTITGNSALDNNHTNLKTSGRYVRIYGSSRALPYGYSIFELEVYSTTDTIIVIPPSPTPTGNEIFKITPTGYDYLNPSTKAWSAMTKHNGAVSTGGTTLRGQVFSNTGTGRALTITASNIVIENCIIGEGNGVAVYIAPGVNNVTIKNCLFHNIPLGVHLNRTTGNIKFIDNWVLNMEWDWLAPVLGFRNGQFIFFEAAGGTGNEVVGNYVENNFGESFNEDLINTFASSNISVRNNKLRGGQGSFTGGGIIAGDNGSNNIDILNNDLIDPGWYGIQVYGGNDVTVTGNRIWSPNALPWNSVGFLIYNGSGSCTNMVMNNTNSSYYRRRPQFGNIYNYENGGGCSGSIGGIVDDPNLLTKMNFPNHLINCVSVDDYWKLRSMKWRQQAILNSHSNCQSCPDVNPRRPSANAGSNQTVTTASATLNGSTSAIAVGGNGTFTLSKFTWEQVSGPIKAIIASTNSATTTVTGLVNNGDYTFRLVVEQNNSQYNLKTYHSAWTTITKR